MINGINNINPNLPTAAGSNVSNTISLDQVRRRKQKEEQKKKLKKNKFSNVSSTAIQDPVDSGLEIPELVSETAEIESISDLELGAINPDLIDFGVKKFSEQGRNSFEEWLYEKGVAFLPADTFEYLVSSLNKTKRKKKQPTKKRNNLTAA